MPSLRHVLAANAASCFSFGAVFALLPDTVARFLAVEPAPELLVRGLGLVLILNGAHLAIAHRRTAPRRMEILYFCLGDIAWVVTTLGLIAAELWITSTPGIAAALGVAVLVGLFAALQLAQLPARRTARAT